MTSSPVREEDDLDAPDGGPIVIGLIADTHGLIRPEIFGAFEGVELILHAGDVGGRGVLDALRPIAPVHAVFGNTDPPGEPGLEPRLALVLNGRSIHVSHGHECGGPTPARLAARYDADIIVFGHTHKPVVERMGERLIINPGAAGPRRFNLQPSVARLTVSPESADVEIVWLSL